MGRKKPGKPGRRRSGTYTLQQLQPPGYDEWLRINPDCDAALNDPRLSGEAVDLMQRFTRIRPFYRGLIPKQALQLDMVLDTGSLPLDAGDEGVTLVPLQEIGAALGIDTGTGDIRGSFHQLHSVGALLIHSAREDVPLVRIVSHPPRRPGDPWVFHGSPEDTLVPKTCIPAQPGDLAPDEFAALAFLRSHMTRGTKATPEDFATHEGVGSTERARELFAAVAELAEVRGCSACPSAHICTRPQADGPTP